MNSQKGIKLRKTYNDIIKLTHFNCKEENLIDINEKNYISEDLSNLTIEEIKLLNSIDFNKKKKGKIRALTTVLPEGSGVTADMIPKYCYYKKPYKLMGEAFVIDRKHPKLNGKPWQTTSSKKITLKNKYDQLINKLKELE